MKKSPSKSTIGGGVDVSTDDPGYSFLSPLTCTRNSKRYLRTDKKGRPIDDEPISRLNSHSKMSLGGRQSGLRNQNDGSALNKRKGSNALEHQPTGQSVMG